MPKYELSIKANYLPGWGNFRGCSRNLCRMPRMLRFNTDAPMSISFAKRKRAGRDTGAIVITNTGTVLPKEALLIGHTSKEGDQETHWKIR